MGSPRTDEILEALRWLALTPGGQRKARLPELTPLSETEAKAIRETLEAVEMGIDVSLILELDRLVEEWLQSPGDRKKGTIAPQSDLPPLFELLRRDKYALMNHRVRVEFLRWLFNDSTETEAHKAVRIIRKHGGRFYVPKAGRRREAARRIRMRIEGFVEAGMTKGKALRAVTGGEVGPVPRRLQLDYGYPETFPPLPPISVGKALSLLRELDREERVPPRQKHHKRPGRNKRETPGNPVYSGPKSVRTSRLSTISACASTEATGGRRDDRHPDDDRRPRPDDRRARPDVEAPADARGRAPVRADRRPRVLPARGRGGMAPGPHVPDDDRGDDPPRKRPGRVKRRPPP